MALGGNGADSAGFLLGKIGNEYPAFYEQEGVWTLGYERGWGEECPPLSLGPQGGEIGEHGPSNSRPNERETGGAGPGFWSGMGKNDSPDFGVHEWGKGGGILAQFLLNWLCGYCIFL